MRRPWRAPSSSSCCCFQWRRRRTRPDPDVDPLVLVGIGQREAGGREDKPIGVQRAAATPWAEEEREGALAVVSSKEAHASSPSALPMSCRRRRNLNPQYGSESDAST